jgi:hypothetical protein
MSNVGTKKELSALQKEGLLKVLKARFDGNMSRHKGLDWAQIQPKLEANVNKLWSLSEMERTGGTLFVDRRFDTVFVYHNGAESYYGGRGFRGSLRV